MRKFFRKKEKELNIEKKLTISCECLKEVEAVREISFRK